MGKLSTHVTEGNKHKSELDKFQIFYELATPTTGRNRAKRISRRRNDA